MKYYSENLDKMFDTEEGLKKAEEEQKKTMEALKERLHKREEEKKIDLEKVEKAFADYKAADNITSEKYNEYIKIRNQYSEKYNEYKYTDFPLGLLVEKFFR